MIQSELGAQVVFRIGLSKKGHPQVIQVKHIVPASAAMVSMSSRFEVLLMVCY